MIEAALFLSSSSTLFFLSENDDDDDDETIADMESATRHPVPTPISRCVSETWARKKGRRTLVRGQRQAYELKIPRTSQS